MCGLEQRQSVNDTEIFWEIMKFHMRSSPLKVKTEEEKRVNSKLFLKDVLKKIIQSTFIIGNPSNMQMYLE